MKNIYEILKSQGIEIPEDKKETLDKAIAENYKTVAELEGVKKNLEKAESERDTYKTKYDEDIAKRDSDLESLKKQLEEAGADKATIDTLTEKLSTLQNTYDADKENWTKQLESTKYNYALEKKVDTIKFSSNSARKAFLADLKENPLQMKDGNILGFDDFVNAYKESDEDAFITDAPDAGNEDKPAKPSFGGSSSGTLPQGQQGTSEPQKVETQHPIIW